MYSIKTAPTDAIDEKWFQRLKPLMDDIGETFVALMPSDEKLQRAYDEFVASGYQTNPNLYPDIVDSEKLAASRVELERLRQDIESQESDEDIRALYIARVDELIANVDMILGAAAGDAEKFMTANQFVYKVPDPEIFAAACTWIRRNAINSEVGDEIRDAVLKLVPDVSGDATLLLPDSDTFDRVKRLHFGQGGYIDQLFAGTEIPVGVLITPETGDSIVRRVIQNVGSSFDLVDSPSGLWSVLQSQEQVIRPAGFALSKRQFMAIVAHEVGSHLLESTNGAVARLKLLEQGLDRYECGNEGRAFLREQIMYDQIEDYVNQPLWTPSKASWEYRVAIHLVISMAVGLHERKYNFAEVYELLVTLFRFWSAKRGEKLDNQTINQGAWNMAVRALKGTDGSGGAYLKDIVYLEGNIRCWRSAADKPESILLGDIGKFDIANKQHLEHLMKLGVVAHS